MRGLVGSGLTWLLDTDLMMPPPMDGDEGADSRLGIVVCGGFDLVLAVLNKPD